MEPKKCLQAYGFVQNKGKEALFVIIPDLTIVFANAVKMNMTVIAIIYFKLSIMLIINTLFMIPRISENTLIVIFFSHS